MPTEPTPPAPEVLAERERCAEILHKALQQGGETQHVTRAFKAIQRGTPVEDFKPEPQ